MMSLYQFGFTGKRRGSIEPHTVKERVPPRPHFPDQDESGLGRVEYREVVDSVVDLTYPDPTEKSARVQSVESTPNTPTRTERKSENMRRSTVMIERAEGFWKPFQT